MLGFWESVEECPKYTEWNRSSLDWWDGPVTSNLKDLETPQDSFPAPGARTEDQGMNTGCDRCLLQHVPKGWGVLKGTIPIIGRDKNYFEVTPSPPVALNRERKIPCPCQAHAEYSSVGRALCKGDSIEPGRSERRDNNKKDPVDEKAVAHAMISEGFKNGINN